MSKVIGFKIDGVEVDIKQVYDQLGISLARFTELLDRDFYAPTLDAAPTSGVVSYTDTDGSTCPFCVGQLCRVVDSSVAAGYRFYIAVAVTESAVTWEQIPDSAIEYEVAELRKQVLAPVSLESLPLMNGQPAILFGAGTPQAAIVPDNWIDLFHGGFQWIGKPVCVGQQYIDTTASSGGRYIAVRNGVWDMKWINA